MFGKIRGASTSSLDSLELERPTSKIFRDDPLSIYEVTLMKLKLGSQRELSSHSEQTVPQIETDSASSSSCAGVMKINADCSEKSSQDIVVSPYEEVMAIDTECSSGSVSLGSIDSPCLGSKKQQQNRNVSVLYLFSKFKDSRRQVVTSSCEDAMPIEDGCSESSRTNSSDCLQSLKSMEQQMEKKKKP
nr:uncharacterized protein LOC111995057 [Quercus suber]